MPDTDKRNRNLTVHSREADEIFGKLPSWVIRWGITVIASILLGIVAACCLIRYPQTLASEIVLTSDNPPSDLMARYAGILDSVYVDDGSAVQAGDLIALIATPAVYADVKQAEEVLREMVSDSLTAGTAHEAVRLQGLRLGGLQSDWIALRRSCSDYLNWRNLNQAGKKIEMLRKLEEQSRDYAGYLASQRDNMESNVAYGRISFERDSSLYAGKLISQVEYEQSIMSLHTLENELSSLDASLASARISTLELRRQVLELQLQERSEEMTYLQEIDRGARQLLADIDGWKETYAFIAPFSGVVSLQNVWSRGQHINVGDLVASVTREEGDRITGRMKVPSSGFGKVREGQRVIVRLNGYPYIEFGVLSGVVTAISPVPEQTSGQLLYTVSVSFPAGMETTYRKELPFVQQMDGVAEIVTEDMRLIDQFIRPIRSAFVNH